MFIIQDLSKHHHNDLRRVANTLTCAKPLGIKTAFFPKTLQTSQTLQLVIQLNNPKSRSVDHAVLKVELPEGLSYISALVFPKMKGRKVVDPIQADSSLYWDNIRIPKGKSRRFSIKVRMWYK